MKKLPNYCEGNFYKFLSGKTIRVMKITLFLSFLTVFQLFATETYSQLTRLSLNLENIKIADALREIENKSEFYFLYSPKLIDVEKTVTISAQQESITNILSNIFDNRSHTQFMTDRLSFHLRMNCLPTKNSFNR